MRERGLTLVELLIVIAVLAIAGTLILNIFTSTLRGSNKTQILGVIKQNGQAVLETMDKTIREADRVVCVSEDHKSIVVVRNGIYTRYRFVFSVGENGRIQQDNPNKETAGVDPATDKEYTDPAFVNKVCADSDPLIRPVSLTDTNPQTGVSVQSNSIFERNKSAGFTDRVTTKFDLKPAVKASSVVAGQIDAVTFQTTVTLR